MRIIFLILLISSLTTKAQTYEVAMVAMDGANSDTLYTKSGVNTDSLFRLVGGNYVFAHKTRLKRHFSIVQVNGLQSALDGGGISQQTLNDTANAIRTTVNGKAASSHTHPSGDITGLATVATSGSYNDLSNKPAVPSMTALVSDVTNNNGTANTIADVTALSFAVTANTTYKFKFFIVYTSAATTTGSRWSINGPATTFLHYNSNYSLTATSRTFNSGLSGYNLPSASNASSASTGSNIAIIEGIIRPSSNGTVIARFASEVSGSAIVAKGGRSFVEYSIMQ